MGTSYRQTVPEPGDTENVLLRKILQRLNGIASPDDTDAQLLAKILDQLISGGGGGGAAVWGSIVGTLSNQSDLQAALNAAGATPGGPPNAVQFNDAGAFGGDANFTWDGTQPLLTIVGDVEATSLAAPDVLTPHVNSVLGALQFLSNNINRANFSLAGHFLFNTDNTLDIGAAGVTRPRTGYFATSVVSPLFTGALTGAASLNVLKTGDTMTGPLTIIPSSANTIPLTVSGYSVTGAGTASLLDLAGTWNTTGVVTALKLSITNTASGATSKFLNFLGGMAGATSLFSVDTTGVVHINGALGGFVEQIIVNGYFVGPSSESLLDLTSAQFSLSSAGFISWGPGANYVAPDIALRRNGVGILEVDSSVAGTYRDIWVRHLRLATAFTVATLPAAGTQGRMAYVTDALTPTFLTLAVGGGAVIAPVFDNGTNWVTV